MLTGVGSAYINEPVYGLPTDKANEFIADGLGARHESGRDKIIVVSMGTGTSLVKCDGDKIEHIGGIGIGGGTLQGLARLMLKTDDIRTVSEIAVKGDVSNVNLRIKDISAHPLPGLPMSAVASLLAMPRVTPREKTLLLDLYGWCCSLLVSLQSWHRWAVTSVSI